MYYMYIDIPIPVVVAHPFVVEVKVVYNNYVELQYHQISRQLVS